MSSTSSPPKPVPFVAVAAVAWLLCVLSAATGAGEGLTLCPFKLVTGHACPGCGMGRAVVAALRGRWSESLNFHPLGLPLLVVWTGWLAYAGAKVLTRGLTPLLTTQRAE